MKKLFVFFALLCAVVGLSGCSKVSASYAEKINVAAAKEEHITYAEVMEALGDEAQDYTVTILGSTNGVIYAIKGVTNKEEFEELRESDKDTECLIITIINNKATAAKYATTAEANEK